MSVTNAALCGVLPVVAAGINAPGSTKRAVITPANGATIRAYCKQRLGALQFGLRDFPLTAQVVHGLRHDQVGRSLARLGHPLVVGAAHRRLSLVLHFVGQQFGHLNLRQQLPFLDRVALINGQRLEITGDLGVKRRFLDRPGYGRRAG